MIDNICGGRLIAGFVVGGGPEYYSLLDQPGPRPRALPRGARHHHARRGPSPARSSTSASTTSCATSTRGRGRCSSRTPRSGSPAPGRWRRWSSSPSTATRTWASRTSTSTCSSAQFRMFREACEREGYTSDPQAGGLAGADLRGRDRRAGPRASTRSTSGTSPSGCCPASTSAPPGYTSLRSIENILKGAGSVRHQPRDLGRRSSRAGTPSSARPTRCTRSSIENIERLGHGQPARACSSSGTLPADLTRRNLELFASRGHAAAARARSPRASRSCGRSSTAVA